MAVTAAPCCKAGNHAPCLPSACRQGCQDSAQTGTLGLNLPLFPLLFISPPLGHFPCGFAFPPQTRSIRHGEDGAHKGPGGGGGSVLVLGASPGASVWVFVQRLAPRC